MRELTSAADIDRVLREARTIAVVGAHREEHRAAFYVPEYLAEVGYRILPVNPSLVGMELFGHEVVARLPELTEPVDMVNVFRRSDRVVEHVDDILAMTPRPKVVWLQLGIRNDAAMKRLIDAGIEVVQDSCTLAEHRRMRRQR